MTLMDAIAEAQVHATQARRSEKEAHGFAHASIDRGEWADAQAAKRHEATYAARADAWERAGKLMAEVAKGQAQGGAS